MHNNWYFNLQEKILLLPVHPKSVNTARTCSWSHGSVQEGKKTMNQGWSPNGKWINHCWVCRSEVKRATLNERVILSDNYFLLFYDYLPTAPFAMNIVNHNVHAGLMLADNLGDGWAVLYSIQTPKQLWEYSAGCTLRSIILRHGCCLFQLHKNYKGCWVAKMGSTSGREMSEAKPRFSKDIPNLECRHPYISNLKQLRGPLSEN